ncbi:MAG: pyridoxamine 5'-phosphate oxidase family protein [Anaerolineales bacterium]
MNATQKFPSFQKPRRTEMAVEDVSWIQDFLLHASFGVIAFIQDKQPYLHTNLFVYETESGAIYMHSGLKGRMPAAASKGLPACFTVIEMGRLLPASKAISFDVEYASVVAFGQLSILADRAQRRHGLQLLLDKYAPHIKPAIDYQPIQPEELDKTVVYHFAIESWSGKLNQEDEDFPGAYYYPDWSALNQATSP